MSRSAMTDHRSAATLILTVSLWHSAYELIGEYPLHALSLAATRSSTGENAGTARATKPRRLAIKAPKTSLRPTQSPERSRASDGLSASASHACKTNESSASSSQLHSTEWVR